MASFIIREKGRPSRAYKLEQPTIVIGRADTAQLVLPNVSVSRRHAMVVRSDQGWVVMDMDSQNGTIVNGERIKRRPLQTGDEVQVGKFLLVFQGDDVAAALSRADPDTMPGYASGANVANGEMTSNLSISELRRMRAQIELKDRALVIDLANPKNQWKPGGQVLMFGKNGIPVDGFGGAEVAWDGNAHVLRKTGLLGTVTVNNLPISAQPLKPGDTFAIGKSRYRYEGPT